MVQGIAFLSKKSFHTANLNNQEKVWIAEQKKKAEDAKTKELAEQIQLEREQEELERIADGTGKNKKQRLDRGINWMYEEGGGAALREELEAKKAEEFLLGKAFVDTSAAAPSTTSAGGLDAAISNVSSRVKNDSNGDQKDEQLVLNTNNYDDPRNNSILEETAFDRNEDFRLRYEDPMYAVLQQYKEKKDEMDKKKALFDRVIGGDSYLQVSKDRYENVSEVDINEHKKKKIERHSKSKSRKKERKSHKYDDHHRHRHSHRESRHRRDKKHAKKHRSRRSRSRSQSRSYGRSRSRSRSRSHSNERQRSSHCSSNRRNLNEDRLHSRDSNSDNERRRHKRSSKAKSRDRIDTHSDVHDSRRRSRGRSRSRSFSPVRSAKESPDNHHSRKNIDNDEINQHNNTNRIKDTKQEYGLKGKDTKVTKFDAQSLGPDPKLLKKVRDEKKAMRNSRRRYDDNEYNQNVKPRKQMTEDERREALRQMQSDASDRDQILQNSINVKNKNKNIIHDCNTQTLNPKGSTFLDEMATRVHGIGEYSKVSRDSRNRHAR